MEPDLSIFHALYRSLHETTAEDMMDTFKTNCVAPLMLTRVRRLPLFAQSIIVKKLLLCRQCCLC